MSATPRQLESLIRLSESLARMELQSVVLARHVQEAMRLMKVRLTHVSALVSSSVPCGTR